jgi:hypothetical protein
MDRQETEFRIQCMEISGTQTMQGVEEETIVSMLGKAGTGEV